MEYLFQAAVAPADVAGDCVVVGVYKDGLLSNAAYQLDTQSNGALRKYLDMGDFTGKKQELALYYHIPNVSSKRVLLVGLGDKKKMTLATLLQATRSAVRYLNDRHIQQAVSFLSDEASHEEQSLAVRRSVQAAAATLYCFDAYKSAPKKEKNTGLVQWTIAHTEEGDHRVALEQGEGIARGMSLARDLGNQPGNVCTPTYLEEVAKGIVADSAKASLEVLEESDMEALGMGAFMSVSKGSSQPGKMLILHYNGGEESEPPVLLLGKGITFDTGGISLKPGAKMDEMKYDMMGAGSVLGSLRACVDMQLPLNVIGMVAAAENMPSGHASKPGDIVKTLSGKTVEILNTDAEGRLVLCDALTYAERFKPALVVDVATLTGACIVALGHHISALMANDDALAEELTAIGKSCDDEVWRLPLGDLYQEQLKSNFADMANIGGPSAGAITAGCFLARFAGQFKWAHLDIAGTAWEGGASKGATGRPVPLLTGLLLKRAKLI